MHSRSPRLRRVLLGSATTIALLATGLAAASPTASGAPGEGPECPEAYPEAELTLGQQVTGLTTAGSYRRGGVEHDSRTTPESITGFYRGTIEDDSGDLMVFELEGSRITRPDGSVDAGIWSGISGSPLYAADGRLVGSVSYSFGSVDSSVFAGVTPAADLYDLLDETDPAAPAARIKPDSREHARLVGEGVPASTASVGAVRLKTDLQISGLGNRVDPRTLRAIAKKSGRSMPRAAGGSSSQAEDIEVVAGGNVAVSDSHGSLALYSVGTAAAVCEGVVIGYGHFADWTPMTRTVHGASTVLIQDDGILSYKIANLGAPQGTLLHDRFNGITGRLGPVPTTATVEIDTDGPKDRSSTTAVSNPDALPFVVATQAYRDAGLALDELAGGRAEVSWSIDYVRENGRTGTFRRSQRYASAFSVPDEVPTDVAGDVEAILYNGFENVSVTGVRIDQDVSRGYRAHDLGAVEVAQRGRWTRVPRRSTIRVVPGKTLRLRVNLKRSHGAAGTAPFSKVVSLRTPKKGVRSRIAIDTHGGSFWDDEEEWYDEEEMPSGPTYRSFDQLLAGLASSPRQDRVDVTLTTVKKSGRMVTRTVAWTAPAVVTGSYVARVQYKGRR